MTLQCLTKYRFRTKYWTPYRTYWMQIESCSQSRARIWKPFPYILIQIEPQIAFRESKTKYQALWVFEYRIPNQTLPIPHKSEYRSSMIQLPDPNEKPLKIWIRISLFFYLLTSAGWRLVSHWTYRLQTKVLWKLNTILNKKRVKV